MKKYIIKDRYNDIPAVHEVHVIASTTKCVDSEADIYITVYWISDGGTTFEVDESEVFKTKKDASRELLRVLRERYDKLATAIREIEILTEK